ncbi:hypothetical protein AAVH_42426, partial [Aphelenchoides avenae]
LSCRLFIRMELHIFLYWAQATRRRWLSACRLWRHGILESQIASATAGARARWRHRRRHSQ